MRIDELKIIAEENDYKIERIIDYEEIVFVRQVSSLRFITNFITIGLKREVGIIIKNTHCDEKDIKMIKAAMEFRETPPEDREEITKTKEFIKRVEELGYEVIEGIKTIDIIEDGFIIATVWKNRIYAVNIFFSTEDKYENEDKLFGLIADYVKIPIEDREKR